MIILPNHGLAFLSITKCASTSIEAMLAGEICINIGGNAGLKHTKYVHAEEFLVPFLEKKGISRPHFFAVLREPADRLFSWYAFRSRDELRNAPKGSLKRSRYTGQMSFTEFADLHLNSSFDNTATPKSFLTDTQISYILDSKGNVGVDTLIPIDYLSTALPTLFKRFKVRQRFIKNRAIIQKNKSPVMDKSELTEELRNKINRCDRFVRDYDLYQRAMVSFDPKSLK